MSTRDLLNRVGDVIVELKSYLKQNEPEDEIGERLQVRMDELKELIKKVQIHSKDPARYKAKSKESDKQKQKCQYWNIGYCREELKCRWSHQEGDCDNYVLKRKCGDKSCQRRHRRICRYW